MPDRPPLHHPGTYLRRLYARQRDSDTMLGIAVAVIAVFFLAGIITAFVHASDLTQQKQERVQARIRASTQTSQGATGGAQSQTTGSASTAR
jgi:hypothetical protein